MEAKLRYIKLTSILEKISHPWSSLYLFLAEAHFLLSDYHGCLEYLNLLSQLLPSDEKLSHLLQIMPQLLVEESIQENNQTDVEGITLHTSNRISKNSSNY